MEKKYIQNSEELDEIEQVLPLLRKELLDRLNLAEFKEVAFDMAIDVENLAGETRGEKIMELLLFAKRHKRITELIQVLKDNFPYGNWELTNSIAIESDATRSDKEAPKYLLGELTQLLEMENLVREFNRNRYLSEKKKTSYIIEGNDIAYRMFKLSPALFGQLDVTQWMESKNPGKRLAVIKYLVWSKDIEYAELLANQLQSTDNSGDTFQTYHILIALFVMADQLSFDYRRKVRKIVEEYTPSKDINSTRELAKTRVLDFL